LDYKIIVSDIIGKGIVSKRFADKDELKVIMNCSRLLYYDPYFAGEIYSNQKQHNTAFEAEPI
jgi:hypothetical protein